MRTKFKNWLTTLLGVGIIAMITYHISEITIDVATVGYIAGLLLLTAKDKDIINIIKDFITFKTKKENDSE